MNGPTQYRLPNWDRPNVLSRYWSPQVPGEQISGWFAGIATEQGQYGPSEMLGLFDPLNRERVLRLSVELDDALRALKPAIGAGISIVYLGTDLNGKRGRSFRLALAQQYDNRARMSMTGSEAAIMGTAAPGPVVVSGPTEDAPPF